MRNIAFVVWLIGAELTSAVTRYLWFLQTGIEHEPGVADLLNLVLYVWIAFVLYEPKDKKIKEGK